MKVSIIIAILNVEAVFEKCLISILNQNYNDFELIIIDGCSSDSTIHLLQKYRNKIDILICEPDSGIYDAWNKGVKISHGDWLVFMGADDTFNDSESLSDLVNLIKLDESTNYISGKGCYVDSDGNPVTTYGKKFNSKSLRYGMFHFHPGSLHHRSLFEKGVEFNKAYRIAGDFHFFIQLRDVIKAKFLNRIIINAGSAGLSKRRISTVIWESCLAINDGNFGLYFSLRYFFVAYLKYSLRKYRFY